jgi:hypothetical protein
VDPKLLVCSARNLSLRTSGLVEQQLDEFIAEASRVALHTINRAEAGRRLLVMGLREWPGGGTPANDDELVPAELLQPSGKMLSMKISLLIGEQLDAVVREVSEKACTGIERAEAARRLIALGIRAWRRRREQP